MLMRVNELIKENLKDKNAVNTNIFRQVKSELINNSKSHKPREEMDVVKSWAKKLTKCMDAYTSRPDLQKNLAYEIGLIKTLLPEEVSSAVISDHVSVTIQNTLSAGNKLNAGPIIGAIKKQLPNANGGLVAKLVQEKLKESSHQD